MVQRLIQEKKTQFVPLSHPSAQKTFICFSLPNCLLNRRSHSPPIPLPTVNEELGVHNFFCCLSITLSTGEDKMSNNFPIKGFLACDSSMVFPPFLSLSHSLQQAQLHSNTVILQHRTEEQYCSHRQTSCSKFSANDDSISWSNTKSKNVLL